MSKVVLQVLVMGPPGAGKSTLGKTLAAKLGYAFVEGDDLHSKGNRKKMIDGIVLNDVDRVPWLATIGDVLNRWRAAETGVVLACSALKRTYRDALRAGRPELRLVYLRTDTATLSVRVKTRPGHFMPPSLLDAQLRMFEPPAPDEQPITVTTQPVEESQIEEVVAAQVEEVIAALRVTYSVGDAS